jgi:hypothetical protein
VTHSGPIGSPPGAAEAAALAAAWGSDAIVAAPAAILVAVGRIDAAVVADTAVVAIRLDGAGAQRGAQG